MSITEKHVYVSDTLPEAPERLTLAEAEADEARGVELATYSALLPTLTMAQRDAAWDAARGAARGATAARGAGWPAQAIVARDLITPEQFDILTAPMRAAGIDFDNLTGGDAQ